VDLELAQQLVVNRELPLGNETLQLNPTLEAVPLATGQIALVWRDPSSGEVVTTTASEHDLLSIALLTDEAGPYDVDPDVGPCRDARYALLLKAAQRGLVLVPPSRVRRSRTDLLGADADESMITTSAFTLQWHITNRCELHCKHCYDRTRRHEVSPADGHRIIQEFGDFCRSYWVHGHVTFTGGNPFLHAAFFDLYAAAVNHAFGTSVLANPVSEAQVTRLLDIGAPDHFQVSLEGREEHNDRIRGRGHFRRVIAFLELLKRMAVPSAVMLTLTRDNVREVIPLVHELTGLVDAFAFSRLAPFGEGASLAVAEPEEYQQLLREYAALARQMPQLRLKENLFNLLLTEEPGTQPSSGCTPNGCGAAFNVLTLLADGEVHACRRMPSVIGHTSRSTLTEIYESAVAARYRRRPDACRPCNLIAQCGGCPAVTSGLGLDGFRARDPYCWKEVTS
jgi:selenobiotic family peptide radical SAM maturase